jgi:hypothetical protein
LLAHRASGYADKAAAERAQRRKDLGIATEHSYA